MLKVGIVGCGNIFTMHATSCDYLPNAQLVGVCDIKKDRANAAAKKYSGAADYFETACAAIDEMYRQTGNFEFDDDGMLKKGVIIRHLIMPGLIENSLKVIDYVSKRFAPGEVLFGLMRQYIPHGKVSENCFPEINRRVSDEEYQLIEDALFASGIEDGYVQDESSASSEFIPQFDNTGV